MTSIGNPFSGTYILVARDGTSEVDARVLAEISDTTPLPVVVTASSSYMYVTLQPKSTVSESLSPLYSYYESEPHQYADGASGIDDSPGSSSTDSLEASGGPGADYYSGDDDDPAASTGLVIHSDVVSATMDSYPHLVDLELACDGEGIVCGAGTLVVTQSPWMVPARSAWTLVAPVNGVINVFIDTRVFGLCIDFATDPGVYCQVVRLSVLQFRSPFETVTLDTNHPHALLLLLFIVSYSPIGTDCVSFSLRTTVRTQRRRRCW